MNTTIGNVSFGTRPRLTTKETNRLIKHNLTIPLDRRIPAEIDDNVITIKVPKTKSKLLNKFYNFLNRILDR